MAITSIHAAARAALVGATALLLNACGGFTGTAEPQIIDFWNGNRTTARQDYEREVLSAVLDATVDTHGQWQLKESVADYPRAEDEGGVFRVKGHDLFVTVAGNQKLAGEDKIVLPTPIMKGLLGYRIPIVREADREKLAQVESKEQLQALRLGIPETWADAELFRSNGYTVVEKGDFDGLFRRLAAGEFDYVAFGANEIAGVYQERAQAVDGLVIDDSLLIYYPFPLVFYIHPERKALAERVRLGLQTIEQNGTLDRIFERYYGDVVERLSLNERQLISLSNPILPPDMGELEPQLLKK